MECKTPLKAKIKAINGNLRGGNNDITDFLGMRNSILFYRHPWWGKRLFNRFEVSKQEEKHW